MDEKIFISGWGQKRWKNMHPQQRMLDFLQWWSISFSTQANSNLIEGNAPEKPRKANKHWRGPKNTHECWRSYTNSLQANFYSNFPTGLNYLLLLIIIPYYIKIINYTRDIPNERFFFWTRSNHHDCSWDAFSCRLGRKFMGN